MAAAAASSSHTVTGSFMVTPEEILSILSPNWIRAVCSKPSKVNTLTRRVAQVAHRIVYGEVVEITDGRLLRSAVNIKNCREFVRQNFPGLEVFCRQHAAELNGQFSARLRRLVRALTPKVMEIQPMDRSAVEAARSDLSPDSVFMETLNAMSDDAVARAAFRLFDGEYVLRNWRNDGPFGDMYNLVRSVFEKTVEFARIGRIPRDLQLIKPDDYVRNFMTGRIVSMTDYARSLRGTGN